MAEKERSPNYPGIALSKVAPFAREVYSSEGKTPIPMEALSRALGHDSLSGAARTKISSMRQYGLLDRVSGRYRLSRIGLELALHGPSDPEYKEALRLAASTPKLFAELFRDYGEASENTIRLHLIKDSDFSEEGARRAAKAFVTTRKEAGIAAAAATDDAEAEDDEAGDELSDNGRGGVRSVASDVTRGGTDRERLRSRHANLGDEHGSRGNSFNWLLHGGVNAHVEFSGEVTSRAIDMLVQYLNLMKQALPDSAPPPPTPDTAQLRE